MEVYPILAEIKGIVQGGKCVYGKAESVFGHVCY
jgi:hypothetical protein